MTEDSQEHDDAYYEKLLARVDNTISDSRTRDRGDQPLNLQISNDHSISGVFFYYEEDSLTLAHRFSLMLLSITYVMFFALCTASEDTETKGFAGSWFLITITWQPLNLLLRRVLRRPRFSQKNYLWPYGMMGAVLASGIIDLIIAIGYAAKIEMGYDFLKPAFVIFLTTWTTNWIVELPVIYYVLNNDLDMSKQENYITSEQQQAVDSIIGTTSSGVSGSEGVVTNL